MPIFDHDPVDPLVAYLRQPEKISATTGKIVYNCLPPDEWGEALPDPRLVRPRLPTGDHRPRHAAVERIRLSVNPVPPRR